MALEYKSNELKTDIVREFNDSTNGLIKNWTSFKNSKENWDIYSLKGKIDILDGKVISMSEKWANSKEVILNEVKEIQEYIKSDKYIEELERYISDGGIQMQGTFPQYELPPFKLIISIENLEIKLVLGRKQEKTTIFNPEKLSKWIAANYLKVTKNKFDQSRFSKELLDTYKILNPIAYGDKEILWGHAVSLNSIYELLTIRKASKRDYPKELYIFELGQMKEQFNSAIYGYRFELGFARNQNKAIVIIDSQGRESRVSSLTIYKEGEEI